MPFAEMKLLYRVLVKRSGTSEVYQEAQDYRAVSTVSTGSYTATDHGTLTGLGDPDHPASAITVDTSTFGGKLSGTDTTVQAALATLDDHTHAGGSGDVVGPASSVDNQVARFDLATGKLIQASLMVVDDNGKPNIPSGQTYDINGSPHTHTGLVTNGDSHDHSGGDGAQISHTTLSNIGTTSHADLDTFVGVPRPYDMSAPRRTGTTRERWYTMPVTGTAMTVSTALTSGRIYAHPFLCPKTITLDRIGVNCTTLIAAGKLRLGIYNDNNGEPGTRLLDAGEVDTSATGVKTLNISQQLTGGVLYWLVAASNSGTHAFRVPAIAATINVGGVGSTLGTAVMTHYYAAQTYGALPSSFPTPTEGTSLVYPAIFVRLSA
jgi:hypothetical protein